MATEVKIESKIQAPIEKVWAELTDYGSYEDWNPVIKEVGGEIRSGGKGYIKISLNPKLPPLKTGVKFLNIQENREVRWKGGQDFAFAGEHYFILEELEKGKSTKLIHGEKFSGPIAKLAWPLIQGQLNELYGDFNTQLKARAEA